MINSEQIRAADALNLLDMHGETVIYDPTDGAFLGLDPVGSRIWNRLTGGTASFVELVSMIEAEFDAERPIIERDISEFLDQLSERKLITIA